MKSVLLAGLTWKFNHFIEIPIKFRLLITNTIRLSKMGISFLITKFWAMEAMQFNAPKCNFKLTYLGLTEKDFVRVRILKEESWYSKVKL